MSQLGGAAHVAPRSEEPLGKVKEKQRASLTRSLAAPLAQHTAQHASTVAVAGRAGAAGFPSALELTTATPLAQAGPVSWDNIRTLAGRYGGGPDSSPAAVSHHAKVWWGVWAF
jgi:hypothetical protein